MLKYKEVRYFEVEYYDLENFLKEVYELKVRPEIVAMQEYHNNMSDTFDIEKEEIDIYDLKKLEEFNRTGYCSWGLRTVLVDLCNRDLIPEGQYLINISW